MACFSESSRVSGGILSASGAKMPFAEPGIGANYAPSWTFRVTHAHVRLRFEPQQGLWSGRTTFTVSALPTYKGVLRFDLAHVQVESVVGDEEQELRFRLDDGHLLIFAETCPRQVTVVYGGERPHAGLYFTGPTASQPERQHMVWTQCQDEDAHFFMPCLDHPRIKHTWTIELDAPAGYTLVSNGARVEESERDGRAVASFEQADPMPAYLFTAVAAKLKGVEHTWRGLSVRYLIPEEDEGDAELAMGRTPEMMDVFSEFTGVDYPWPRYDQVVVHDFIFGGMENTACTLMTDVLLVTPRVGDHWDPDGLVCHELAHQWFGDYVTCQDWSQAWLNESFATFMETVWWDHAKSKEEAVWLAWQQASNYIGEDAGRYRRPIMSYDFREPIDVFDRHLYEKGSVVLRTLRFELGDEAFKAGVKRYLDSHAHGTVHGRHLLTAMEEATGQNLDRFYFQWIEGAGHPALKVSLAEEQGLVTVNVEQTQKGEKTAEAFHFPLRLELVMESGEEFTVTLPVRERQRVWAIPTSGAIKTVRVDPGFRLLSEITLLAPESWLVALASDPCPVLAVRAVRALAQKNTPGCRKALHEVLANGDFWGVRAEAAKKLSSLGGAESHQALLDALSTETESRAAVAIAGALAPWRDEATASALIATIDAGPSTDHLHAALLQALGKTREERAAAVLSDALSVDSWGDVVRQNAMLGLAWSRNPKAFALINEHSKVGQSDRLRAASARALGRLGKELPSTKAKVEERLIEMLTEGGFRATLGTIAGLSTLGSPKALPYLELVHGSSPDGRTRRMAYEAIVAVRGLAGAAGPGLDALHARLDTLADENRALRARLEKLETLTSDRE